MSCGTLIIKIKNKIFACSIVSRVFIYASNKLLHGTLKTNLGENWICVCYCKQLKTSLQESNKNTRYVLAIWYEQFRISAKTTKNYRNFNN